MADAVGRTQLRCAERPFLGVAWGAVQAGLVLGWPVRLARAAAVRSESRWPVAGFRKSPKLVAVTVIGCLLVAVIYGPG